MTDLPAKPDGVTQATPPLPWYVHVSPYYYDDAADTGFGWEGWAVDEEHAVRQALKDCFVVNDREPETEEDDTDPEQAKVHIAEIDFRRLAGPLVHWARSMGGWDTPLWQLMETAVLDAKLAVAPLDIPDA
jgi:hypothetical protein